jgi:dTMP kinase
VGRGLFITLEGIDGCGKTTQARLLAGWLRRRGFSVVCTDEPTDGPVGRVVKRILRGELRVPVEVEVFLFAADRAWHLANVVEPALGAGRVVINERYVGSSLAYQTARGASRTLVRRANEFARRPDLAIFIDVPPRVAASRIRRERDLDEFERDLGLQELVRKGYLELVKRGEMARVDGTRGKKEVQNEIRKLVATILP